MDTHNPEQAEHLHNDEVIDAPPISGDSLQKEVNQWKDKYLRATAEMDNIRKRLETLHASQLQQERRRILTDMLPVADNLERALQHAVGTNGETGALRTGVELTLKALLDTLQKYGVSPIEAEGKPFDAMLHEAVGTVRSAVHEPGSIVKVEQRGYLLGHDLLRPARVIVAVD